MYHFEKHLINENSSVKEALVRLNELASDAILFVVDEDRKLIGSLTDGDIRRGLIKEIPIDSKLNDFLQPNPRSIRKDKYHVAEIVEFRKKHFTIIPVLDSEGRVVNVVNLRKLRSYLPVDTIIMAGGRGSRLKPLTDTVPKPLLKIGDKPIIEHNIDRIASYGVVNFWISIRYLGEKIAQYLKNGADKSISIEYIREEEPLGTIGAAKKIKEFYHDYLLASNSDILTNLDYEDFFLDFVKSNADISVVSIPYKVEVPYAVLETSNGILHSFKEKPTYTYYSNGGIYLMKKELVHHIPEDTFYDATDLLEFLIGAGYKVTTYPLTGYWLDIGSHEDFQKAKQDIQHILF